MLWKQRHVGIVSRGRRAPQQPHTWTSVAATRRRAPPQCARNSTARPHTPWSGEEGVAMSTMGGEASAWERREKVQRWEGRAAKDKGE